MKYNKLIRDNVTEIMSKKGKIQLIHIANDEEYWEKLKEKLEEEVKEPLQSESEEELADILEVVNSICDFKKIDVKELDSLRKKKSEERGAFGKRIILDEVKD